MVERFINSENDLIDSVVEFYSKPEYWRAVLGGNPIYFLHFKRNNKHYFALSKFCAFRNIQVEQYIAGIRNDTNGNITQKHIAKKTGKKWVPRRSAEKDVRDAFDIWIKGFKPTYQLNKALFISLTIK